MPVRVRLRKTRTSIAWPPLCATLGATTGTLTLQFGDVTKDQADSDHAEAWQGASGVITRPALATQGKASCQAFFIRHSDRDIAVGYRDLRANQILGNLAPGETALYALLSLGETRDAEPAEFARLIASLNAAGLKNDARALALEIALAYGI